MANTVSVQSTTAVFNKLLATDKVVLTLNSDDTNNIRFLSLLAKNQASTYIPISENTIIDISGVSVISRKLLAETLLRVNSYTPDIAPTKLTGFFFDIFNF